MPPSSPSTWRATCAAGLLTAATAGLLLKAWGDSQPPIVQTDISSKLACASYTPSHNGHTLDPAAQRLLVNTDLRLLARHVSCVRTYSVGGGLDQVPAVARDVGLKVMLGLWISSHGPSNDAELAKGIALANRYPDVVTAVVVGNEVLLRREQTAAQLSALLERVRSGVRVPVTYADVWEFWLRNPALLQSTDFPSIHILPYWEDQPVGIDHALDHVRSIYAKVQAAFPGKRIFLGETGWPSAGRPRMDAVPSRANQARFVREFVGYAERNGIPYNLIEAFDQPWKRSLEGTVGGYWGLFNAQGEQKFPLLGALPSDRLWIDTIWAGLGGAVLFLAFGFKSRRAWLLLSMGALAGSLAVLQYRYLSTANVGWLEWTGSSLWTAAGWACYLFAVRSERHASGVATVLQSLGHGGPLPPQASALLGILRFLALLGAAYAALALAYEGRGRDFPVVLLAPAAVGLSLNAWFNAPNSTDRYAAASEEIMLLLALAMAGTYVAWQETTANLRAMSWVGLSAWLVLVVGLTVWPRTNPYQRPEQQARAA
jgi:exo-beta-1,3-glucanase (GH17 family)